MTAGRVKAEPDSARSAREQTIAHALLYYLWSSFRRSWRCVWRRSLRPVIHCGVRAERTLLPATAPGLDGVEQVSEQTDLFVGGLDAGVLASLLELLVIGLVDVGLFQRLGLFFVDLP